MNKLYATTARLLTAATILFTTFSCQKERDDNPNCAVNMSTLAGTYKLTALKYKASASSPEQDYMLFFDNCEKDDLIKLYANGTYDHVDAGSVCSPDGNYNGTWSLMGNIIISDGDLGGEVQSFNCTKLVTELKDMNVQGDRLTFTLERQ